MVGFRDCQSNWGNQKAAQLVDSALRFLWWKHKSFEIDAAEVEALVAEFSAFVDSPVVRLRYVAQLLNFRMPSDNLPLAGGLQVRRLAEEEIDQLHGGSHFTIGFLRPRFSSIHEFVLEGELEERKILGSNHPAGQAMGTRAKELLDRAILALRTYREGHVGYDFVLFRPVSYCPIGFFPYQGVGDAYVPSGSYVLDQKDFVPFAEHAVAIFGVTEASMEMACSRLADAENRTRPQDRIVDAVIGMEAILLAGLRNEDRRGELKFRFSLHYSTLFESPEERHRAFRVAKHLYDLRSTVAHGGSIGEGTHSVGDEKLTFPQAARRACESLRHVIRHFLPSAQQAPYRKPDYWERAYFGLSAG